MLTPEHRAGAMRMDAYYFSFAPTGVAEVDRILSAVACAGKAYHHTADWQDESSYIPDGHEGKAPADWIENAAIEAATSIAAKDKLFDRVVSDLKGLLAYTLTCEGLLNASPSGQVIAAQNTLAEWDAAKGATT